MGEKMRVAALTHVRNDDFYLNKWVGYYGSLLGRDNLHVIMDGSDWTPAVDLDGVNVHVIERPIASMNRVRIDRRMAGMQRDALSRLFDVDQFDCVIKGDVDELIVPKKGVSIFDAVEQIKECGVVYSLGIDVIQNVSKEAALDPSRPVMSQRHFGIMSQSYCKVNLIGRAAFNAGVTVNAGGHRASKWPVHASQNYHMIHLGFCDKNTWLARTEPRLKLDRGGAFKAYYDERVTIFDAMSTHENFMTLEAASQRAEVELTQNAAGERVLSANRFRVGNFNFVGNSDYAIHLDDRFEGIF